MYELLDLIQRIGFPIAIAVWLLYERHKNIKENTMALHELRDMIKELYIWLKAKNDRGGDEQWLRS